VDANTILKRSENVTFQTVAGEAILIRMDTGTYFSLNPVGTDFWQLLDGRDPISYHANRIATKYNERTEAFFNELTALTADPTKKSNQAIATIAQNYSLSEATVRQNLDKLAAGQPAAALARAYAVDDSVVLADLLELAQRLAAEKLVEES
jgi:hypothetical protein